MSPWGFDRFPKYSPKKPPPKQGIKVNELGTTWWGQRWIEALERVLRGDSGRLARGRSYARAGRTHDFVIQSGRVTAKVTGSRAPYEVSIALPQLSDAAWQTAIEFMAQKAEFSALLLNDEMPQQIDDAFQSAKVSLFPATRTDLETDCDCPDWGDPCKHVAAVHYVLGDALDRDPFLLFELRGRERDQVLSALRVARGSGDARPARSGPTETERPPSVALHELTAENYTAAPVPLPALSFSFEPPPGHGAVLRQLGAPSSWNGDKSPLGSLTSVVQDAAEAARRLALSEATPPTPTPPEAPTRETTKKEMTKKKTKNEKTKKTKKAGGTAKRSR